MQATRKPTTSGRKPAVDPVIEIYREVLELEDKYRPLADLFDSINNRLVARHGKPTLGSTLWSNDPDHGTLMALNDKMDRIGEQEAHLLNKINRTSSTTVEGMRLKLRLIDERIDNDTRYTPTEALMASFIDDACRFFPLEASV
jgi:hypothetical protein